MYFFDPQRGRRRRALVRDKVDHAAHRIGDEMRKTSTDLRNRARGLVYEAASALQKTPPPSDNVLKERVRAASGHAVRHPGKLDVEVRQGVVTVRGNLSDQEHSSLIRRIGKVSGIQDIRDEISPDGAPERNGQSKTNGRISPARVALATAGLLAAGGVATLTRKR